MTTLDHASLAGLLQNLSIGTLEPYPVGTRVLRNPLDVLRTTLAKLLSELVGCDLQTAYNSIQWPNNIFNGDLSVTIPKLCPGRKPAEASAHLVDTVGKCAIVRCVSLR